MRFVPKPARVRETIDEAKDVRTLWLDEVGGPKVSRAVRPGQFVLVWVARCADGRRDDEAEDQVPMSVSGVDERGLAITVRRVGPTTAELHRFTPGDAVGLAGPVGRGFEILEGSALLVAGGIGLAPLLYLADELSRRGTGALRCVVGARTGDELFALGRLDAAADELAVATDDGSVGSRGTAVAVARALAERERPDRICACGPEPMLVGIHRLCEELGVPGQLSLERYMHCGAGVCGACAMNGRRICHDGPVFRTEELSGLSEFGNVARGADGVIRPL